jgi:hypothetical protein
VLKNKTPEVTALFIYFFKKDKKEVFEINNKLKLLPSHNYLYTLHVLDILTGPETEISVENPKRDMRII